MNKFIICFTWIVLKRILKTEKMLQFWGERIPAQEVNRRCYGRKRKREEREEYTEAKLIAEKERRRKG